MRRTSATCTYCNSLHGSHVGLLSQPTVEATSTKITTFSFRAVLPKLLQCPLAMGCWTSKLTAPFLGLEDDLMMQACRIACDSLSCFMDEVGVSTTLQIISKCNPKNLESCPKKWKSPAPNSHAGSRRPRCLAAAAALAPKLRSPSDPGPCPIKPW